MQFEYPILRHGVVIDNDNTPLTLSQSSSVAKSIQQADKSFLNSLSSTFKEAGYKEIKFDNPDKTEIIEYKGTVVSFPSQRFSDENGAVIEARLCLTVCGNQRRSKLWHRFNYVAKSQDVSATELNVSDLMEFNEKMEQISYESSPQLLSIYSDVVNSQYDMENYKLGIYGNLIYLAADTKDESFADFLFSLEYADHETSFEKTDFVSVKETYDWFSAYKSDERKKEREEGFKIESRDGGRGWFLETFEHYRDIRTVRMMGVCKSSMSGQLAESNLYSRTRAKAMTRNLSMHYGGAY